MLGSLAAFVTRAPAADARGRSPVGGSVSVRVPWSLTTVDPHRIDDAASAYFGCALFDTLYAVGEGGILVPRLAESEPEVERGTVRVRLRAGLRSATGKVVEASDVLYSLTRARARSGKAWLANVPSPKVEDKTTLRFATKDDAEILRCLASPLTAIVPSSFSPTAPDGTGPFAATLRGDALVLRRNPLAAGGPAFLDEIVVRSAPDVAGSLRAFESGTDDLGWLGSGLHDPRAGSRPWDTGSVGWAILATGREAGDLDVVGSAQRLADAVPHAKLAYLMIGPSWPAGKPNAWTGPSCDLLVRDDSPWLVELARATAATLGQPGHEVTARPVSTTEFAQRRTTRGFTLALDVVRPFGPGPSGTLVALATADDPRVALDTAKKVPRPGDASPRTLARSLRVGVLGELRASGGRVADVVVPGASGSPTPNGGGASGAGGVDWGSVLRIRKG
ncbi:MAG: ABC transporter substrate-binding protein [Polyangiaceae bacterium]